MNRLSSTLVVLVGAATVLTACGGSSAPNSASNPTTAGTSAAGTSTAGTSTAGTSTAGTNTAGTSTESASGVTGTLSATSVAPATSAGGSGSGSCSSYKAGQNGVIRTFCDGPAKAVLVISGTTKTISGGECDHSGGYFAFNAGVVTTSAATGTRPDYVGADLPDKAGPFTATYFTARIGGTAYLVSSAGTVSAGFSGFTAAGKDLKGTEVSLTVTC